MKTLRSVLLLASILAVLSCPTYAWNKSGHMVRASLAYRELKQTKPDKVQALVALLKKHEHYDEHWRPVLQEVDPGQRDEALFMLAARWPDDMRDPPLKATFHRRIWHFADHAIKFPGAPAGIPGGIIVGPAEPGDQDEGFKNLLDALTHNLEVLASTNPDPERARALCWVIHLTGDLAQPLHMSTHFSDLFPEGDKGGNAISVKVPPNRTALNYHSFWDEIVLKGPKRDALVGAHAVGPDDIADSIVEATKRAAVLFIRDDLGRDDFPQLAQTDRNAWADEGVELARKVAYLNGDLTGGQDHHDPFPLPEGFTKKAQALAEKQIALTGHRLSDLLDD